MSSTSSSASTTLSKISSAPQSQPKDFETAFGNLSSSYGLHGIPSSTVTFMPQEHSSPSLSASSKFTFPSHSSSSTLISKALSPVSPSNSSQSTVHIVPLARHNSVSSDATIVQHNVVESPKRDYEAAFGALSLTYGTAGHIPALPSKHVKSTHTWSKFGGLLWTRMTSTKPMQNARSIVTQPSDIPKANYQAAFGNLSSLYGTGGNVPSFPNKPVRLSHPEVKALKSPWPSKASPKPSQDENIPTGKDYNAAFGSLASSYGLYGCSQLPSMASKDAEF